MQGSNNVVLVEHTAIRRLGWAKGPYVGYGYYFGYGGVGLVYARHY